MEWPTLDQRMVVWGKILADPDAKRAFTKLKRDGFAIDHLTPDDSGHLCWADYIASIPFLSNRPSHRQLHSAKDLRKHLPLVKALRELVAKSGEPFCEIRRNSKKAMFIGIDSKLARDLAAAADLVNEFLTWDWYTRDRNNRNSVIAALRWSIRQRTGTPHDRELGTLIYAAFRAAGIKEDFYLDATTLERIEKLEKGGRVKATCQLNYLSGLSPTPKPPISLSTRFPRNREKRV